MYETITFSKDSRKFRAIGKNTRLKTCNQKINASSFFQYSLERLTDCCGGRTIRKGELYKKFIMLNSFFGFFANLHRPKVLAFCV